MPIIKSAKKRMKQNEVRRLRRLPFKTRVGTEFKKVLEAVKAGDLENAKKLLNAAYSVIDTACKKNIIHQNNAARKKSRLAKAIAELEKKKA
jgi:small subunit ribosomal protein S20